MSELDELMDLDPLSLSAQDIDQIIQYQRKARRDYEAGVKPKKDSGPKVSLDNLMGNLMPKMEPIKRRV